MAHYIQPDVDQFRVVVLNYGELFPEDHPTTLLLEIIRSLDLSEFDENYSNDPSKGGRPAFPVDRILSLIMYSLLHGNISMRNLERLISQRADSLYLSGGLSIDHTSLSVFRKRHAEAIKELFTQRVFLGFESGMIDLDSICIDSTKIKASAHSRAIGTQEELEKRYVHIEEACKKRYQEWESATEEEEKQLLEKKLKRMKRQKEKLVSGIEFLKKNAGRKRVHLVDQDADWQKNNTGGFSVGYHVHAAVESKNKRIVHQQVVSAQADSIHRVALVDAVEKIQGDAAPGKQEKPKYILDPGYSSKDNFDALKEKDVYMPDKAYASMTEGTTKPEDRKEKRVKKEAARSIPDLEFKYDLETDVFICPEDEKLFLRQEREMKGKHDRTCRKYDCGSCALKKICIGDHSNKKAIAIASDPHQTIQTKQIPPYGSKGRRSFKITYPLALEMREKLRTVEGKRIYSLRFPVSEGCFGVMKSVRCGREFFRRGLDSVQAEWSERSIAYHWGRSWNLPGYKYG